MVRVAFVRPLAAPRSAIREIALREPGRRLLAAMAAVRLPGGFTEAQALRYAARLSGVGEATLGRLDLADRAKVKAAVEGVYASASRRLSIKQARAEED